jgi:hypothetical protein
MTRNLPASIIGRINLRAYYNVRGSVRSDVYIARHKGDPEDPAFANAKLKEWDPTLHGRATHPHTTDKERLDWVQWWANLPRSVKTSGPKPTLPERVKLSDVVMTNGDTVITDECTAVILPKPKLADITKACNDPSCSKCLGGWCGLWSIHARPDMGSFKSRQAARDAIKALE